MRASGTGAVAWLMTVLTTAVVASAADENRVDYASEVKPVLRERCYACHGALKQEGGLRLDTAALAIRGGENGPAIVAGEEAASLLIQRITAPEESERMPPEGEPLTAPQIAAIRAWIRQEATAPADETPESDPRDHWSFRPPVRPPVPKITGAAAENVANPIDAFLAREQVSRGLVPQSAADRRIWLRRVSLDLTGLPPTSAELEAFLADDSPDAVKRVVNRLLESPQYGERWGRHWMDIWRYSDWWGLGAEVRNSQKHLWHWRDWIVESLNADKGYDQMLREMLAADELAPDDLDALRGSGFLARQYFKFNRTTWLDGVVEHTSKAMLGLTANCAKCHDHKYDPISHADYYRLRAIFEPYQIRTDYLPGGIDHEKGGLPRAFDCNLDALTHLHIRGDDRNPDTSNPLGPGVPAILQGVAMTVEPVALPPTASRPGLRPFVVQEHIKAAELRLVAATAELAAAKERLSAAEAAAIVAAQSQNDPPKSPQTVQPVNAVLTDDFSAERPADWKPLSGVWTYRDRKLIQSQGGTRAALRAIAPPPKDFEARLRYSPTGGEQWKSVGVAFDLTNGMAEGEHGNEVLAYVSAYAGGPKAQVTYLKGGQHVYPSEAARGIAVELNRPHELVVRVRDRLVNLQLDDHPPVAYRLPIERKPGSLEIIAFDAIAEFHSFELRPLSSGIVLAEPNVATGDTADPPAGPAAIALARLGLAVATAARRTAEADLASVAARAAADRGRFIEHLSAEAAAALIHQAAKAEREATAAHAEEDLARADLARLQAIDAKRPDAEKKYQAAREAVDKAKGALASPGETYTSLPGSYKTLESNVEDEASRSKPFPLTSTGRRSAFAKWLTDRQNPLAARVAVNHIWARHFGRPLVATVFDFGRKGTPPTHPELLDWLAVELMESSWSMKRLHRLIVTSEAYRRSSSSARADAATLAADPENRWYWRANPIRMEAQVVRDSLLHLAGELDPTMTGPPIAVGNDATRRRSLYFVHSHNDHQPFLSTFDDASVLDCYRRAESIVPQQALALENSPLASRIAEQLAARLTREVRDDAEFLRRAFVLILGTEPTAEERQAVSETLPRLVEIAERQKRADPQQQARVRLVQALLNHNDFVTIR